MRVNFFLSAILLMLFFMTSVELTAQLPELTFTELNASFSQPVSIANAGDSTNRLFVVQKQGKIRVYDLDADQIQAADYLDLSDRVSSFFERGLLGLAFHPDFATNGEFYVHYMIESGFGIPEGSNVISRFTLADPAAATVDASTEEIILSSPQDQANHNGGDLKFGPDGYLYASIGDGGGGGDPNDNAQNTNNLMGTIIRIDVDTAIVGGTNYGIPPDNPFADGTGGRPEIYAYGLRNAWRFSFDRLNGDLWIGDVGQNSREEIDYAPNGTGLGKNYGWDCMEGNIEYPGNSSDDCIPGETYTLPIVEMFHSGANSANSITGGYVYRGQKWPDLEGYYFSTDYVTDRYFILKLDENGELDETHVRSDYPTSGITTFGESEDGELFAASIFDGLVYQIGGGISSNQSVVVDNDFKVAVSPNPATNLLRVELNGLKTTTAFKVTLIDQLGRSVLNRNWVLGTGNQTASLHLPRLTAGHYQLVLNNGRAMKTVAVVIK